ncbi:MAG: MlaA family lipoprotein [Pseudoxanthomonas suwonensis]|nr:MlaA family lipoprotein [Pseudoxanthomonas suwonensis]
MNRLSRLLLVIPLTVLLAACAGGQVRHGAAPHAAPLIAADASPATDTAAADEAIADADVAPPAPDLPAVPTADPASAAEGIDSAAAPTQAEHDFALLYGGEPYDPVADADLPDPALLQIAHDPWEPFNRRMHALNNMMDRNVGLPLARAYVATVPRPVRLGVGNFFVNLGQPVSALNALLQGRPGHAAEALARFLVNATLGVGGLFDPASRMGLTLRSEDFGQTLAIWGWERSRYLELPLFGPRTLRDVFGMAGDAPLSPMQHIGDDNARIVLQGLMLVDIRTQLMSVDSMREGAADEYALVRDAWMQRRNYQIHGDRRKGEGEEALPEYLQEEDTLPMLPADALPVPLPGPA